jgi:hypothetical protein
MINQNQRSQPRLFDCHRSSLWRFFTSDEKNALVHLQLPLPKYSIFYLIVMLCTLLLLFSSCSASSPPSQANTINTSTDQATPSASPLPAEALARVNWMNYTYTNSCYSNTQPFHVQHGVAVNSGIHFTVYPPYYGDLTGDARPEAIIPYQCSGADTTGRHVLVYSGTATHPVFLADLPEQKSRGFIDNVTKISIAHEELQLAGAGYSTGTPRCCPDLSIQNNYHWNGSKFMLLQSVVSKR